MRQPAVKEIKRRFAEIEKKHVDDWIAEHPSPSLFAARINHELGVQMVTFDLAKLKEACEAVGNPWHSPDLFEVIQSPSIQRWREEMEGWERRKAAAHKRIVEARESFLDRVLFDHESAYVLLKDFENWRAK